MASIAGGIVAALGAGTILGYWGLFLVSLGTLRRWRAAKEHTWQELWSLGALTPAAMRALVDEGVITPGGEGRWRADARVLEARRTGWGRWLMSMPLSFVLGLAMSAPAGLGAWWAWQGAALAGFGLVLASWSLTLPSWIWLFGHMARHMVAGEPERPVERPWSRDRWM